MDNLTLRKWDLMRKKFGKQPTAITCKNCEHLGLYEHHGRAYCKCKVYGISASEATDWKQSAPACGLYPGIPYNGGSVVREVERGRKKAKPGDIEGQQSLF